MSQHIYTDGDIEVRIGYDRPLDYVFCIIYRGPDNCLYSNLLDPQASTIKQDINYFRPILKRHGIVLPEKMFEEVQHDQNMRVGNRVEHYRPVTQ